MPVKRERNRGQENLGKENNLDLCSPPSHVNRNHHADDHIIFAWMCKNEKPIPLGFLFFLIFS